MLTVLFACTGSAVVSTFLGEDSEPPIVEDTAPPEQIPGAAASSPCSSLYDPETLATFELDIDPEIWEDIEDDYASGRKDYHPAVFRYGEDVIDVQVRLKGNPNFSWISDKFQFVISFNEDDPEGRYEGVRKIALDSSWYEPTLLRDRLAWTLLRGLEDVPAACANNAKLVINGEYYGLYANIEYFDREYLERNFGKSYADGTLWKYGIEAKTNEGQSDSTIVRRFATASSVEALEDIGDVAQWQRGWAIEGVLGNDDGYWCCQHNFYLYEHPTRGVLFANWDLDDAWDVTPYDLDPRDGYGHGLYNGNAWRQVMSDSESAPRHVDEVEYIAEAYDSEELVALVEAWSEQNHEAFRDDPSRSVGWQEHLEAVERFKGYIVQRDHYLESWVRCERGEDEDLDGDGYGPCEDKDDTRADLNPGASETCNGLDDDGDTLIDEGAGCDSCLRRDFFTRQLLFCDDVRDWNAALAYCEGQDATLFSPSTTADVYLTYFYTWPNFDDWYVTQAGEDGLGTCPAWSPSTTNWVNDDCEEAHAFICSIDQAG
ncbi:MAG TPA: CotH kinase family protein [Myxococcota bacterium]|nr:CotH kinase family protein [Myxococcota bacterium]